MGRVMMGRQTIDQSQLFYLFNLEGHIPVCHLLRRINPIVTRILADLRDKLQPFYSEIGRPSIDPELMLRMLIVAYCYGIRSERKLCEEVELHLAYRWFCRLDLDDEIPDHSTFSVNRHGRFRDSAVAEFLTSLDNADADRKPPKVISPVDPCSAWTAKANKRVQFGYGLNYLIDIQYAVIVDVEATPARTYDEVAASKTMIERTERKLGLKPERLAADTASRLRPVSAQAQVHSQHDFSKDPARRA
jgi:transposase